MLLTDWYKVGHPNQYHPNIFNVYSNGTARKSRMAGVEEIVVFSIESFIKEFLIEHFNNNFFNKTEEEIITSYSRRVRTSLLGGDPEPLKHKFYQKNYPGDPYGHIRHLHRLGFLPIIIKALPEGSKVPMRVPFVTVTNDRKKHPEMFWLTNFIESIMSASTWQAITSATIANEYRKLFEDAAMETVGNADFVPFQGHDFSFRGMSSLQSACYSGAAHLLSFVGTDTIPAIDWLEQYYNANADKEMIGVSVSATEHAVMCSNTGFYVWDKCDGDWSKVGECEFEVFKELITVTYPNGIVSIVSDTWNLWRVMGYAKRLKKEILARNGKVVFRPDSGTPEDILCGDVLWESIVDYKANSGGDHYQSPENKGVIELLYEIFGGTITPMGFIILDPHVGTIYGDSISIARAKEIIRRLKNKGFASINWVAGIGSYTYQYNTRDTFGMAIKATYCEATNDDETKIYEIPIFKDPITDDGTKKSAKGLIRVDEITQPDGTKTFVLTDGVSWEEEAKGALEPVFVNGVLVRETSLAEIRKKIRE